MLVGLIVGVPGEIECVRCLIEGADYHESPQMAEAKVCSGNNGSVACRSRALSVPRVAVCALGAEIVLLVFPILRRSIYNGHL